MFGLGFGELILIFVIALIFIGPKKLPELAKGLGQGLKEFQKAAKGFSESMHDTVNDVKNDVSKGITHNLVEPVEPEQPLDAAKQDESTTVADKDTPKDQSHS